MTPEEFSLELGKSYASAAGKESVTTLAKGIQALFPFWGIKKKALDVAIDGIEKSDSSPEEKMFRIMSLRKQHKEWKNQSAILDAAFSVVDSNPELPPPSDIDEEFISRFLDAGKHVSDKDVQIMWGNILAGEFESPGSTPKSVTRVLSEMTKSHAEIFSTLCSMYVYLAPLSPNGDIAGISEVLLVPNQRYFPNNSVDGISFEALNELEFLGLIKFKPEGLGVTLSVNSSGQIYVVYNNSTVRFKNWSESQFPCGTVTLTPAGSCIARFVERKNLADYVPALKNYICSKSKIKLDEISASSLQINEIKDATGKTIYQFNIAGAE